MPLMTQRLQCLTTPLQHWLVIAVLAMLPLHSWAFSPSARLQAEQAGWKDAQPQDVQAVLDSVLKVITPYMASRHFGLIVVKNDPTGPRSLYGKGPNGEYIIQVNIDGRHWARLAYQFSHEMCHLMSNYDLAPNNRSRQQWFEESLCEAFSLFSLEQLSRKWVADPPYPNWKDYAPNFLTYRVERETEPHRQLPPGMKLPNWYQEYRQILSDDPVANDRDLNELVAGQLLPVFEPRPSRWEAINYLNLGDDRSDKSFQKYLNDWENNTPAGLRPPVQEIQRLLLEKSSD